MVAQLLVIQNYVCFANKANSLGFLTVSFLTYVDIDGWASKIKENQQ